LHWRLSASFKPIGTDLRKPAAFRITTIRDLFHRSSFRTNFKMSQEQGSLKELKTIKDPTEFSDLYFIDPKNPKSSETVGTFRS
jgi:hypothetical protein